MAGVPLYASNSSSLTVNCQKRIVSSLPLGVGGKNIRFPWIRSGVQEFFGTSSFPKTFLTTTRALAWPFGDSLLFFIHLFFFSISIFYEPFNYVTPWRHKKRKPKHTSPLANRVRCSPMARETRVQSQVVPYKRLKNWYLIFPCLPLSIIRYVSRVKWSNSRKGIAHCPTLRCSSYWKGNLCVTFDNRSQLYIKAKIDNM